MLILPHWRLAWSDLGSAEPEEDGLGRASAFSLADLPILAHRYKFSIRVPASSALSDRCKNGRIIYHTVATLVGSGSMFKPDISARKESWVMCNPQDEERSQSG